MKKKALAIVLALCMILSMLPVTAFAAPRTGTAGHDLPFVQAPTGLKTDLKPIGTAEPNAKEYTLTLRATENGETGATAYSAAKGESILIMANPDPGYLAYLDTYGDDLELYYIGFDMFELVMPGHNVSIDIYYEAAEGQSYDVDVSASIDCAWYLMDGITSAKEYESVYLVVEESDSYTFDPETDVTADCADFFYLGTLDETGEEHLYELVMPAEDVKITIRTTPVVRERSISVYINEPSYGSVQLTMGNTALPGHTVYFTAAPHLGYKVDSIRTSSGAAVTHQAGDLYYFVMPDADETIYIYFAENINPVSVTVDTGIGGIAHADAAQAKAGDTVTVVCAPEEGYRVAQITGVADLVDNGDNTYTFTMPDEAVELHVLFLRENNPFLDVNETHFFYGSVLWAVEKGITNGLDDTHFGPFAVCNRAQVVTFLWRSAGSPEPTITENPFTDVPAESWYTKAVLWALENGITTGATDTLFDPEGVCMRAHVVTFLWRAKGCPEPVTTENPFEDVAESDFYYKAVLWALENGVTTGADATHFNPLGQCQRAQVVTFLYRADGIPAVHELHWVINGFQDTPSDYGTVTLSHAKAAAGTTITATVVPAEGCVLDWAKCEFGTPVTQVSDTEYTFVMPEHEEVFHVNFSEAPEEPEPTEPEPTDPVDPEPTDPTEPEPTDPVDPEPTDPTDPIEPEEPTKPVKTYELDLKDNGCGTVSYVDGKTEAAVGESIFFYAIPDEGYYLDHVSIFNPDGSIDVSTIRIIEHGDDLYELIMIPRDLIMTCYFYPIA